MIIKLGIALTKDTFRTMTLQHPFLQEADRIRDVTEKNNTYTVAYWEDPCISELALTEFKEDVQKVKHAIIEIRDDSDTIVCHTKTDDAEGNDNMFDEILSWSADVCIFGTPFDEWPAHLNSGSCEETEPCKYCTPEEMKRICSEPLAVDS